MHACHITRRVRGAPSPARLCANSRLTPPSPPPASFGQFQGTFYGAGGAGESGACMLQPGFNGVGVTVAMNAEQFEGESPASVCHAPPPTLTPARPRRWPCRPLRMTPSMCTVCSTCVTEREPGCLT
jgi:hypothetical protein